MSVPGHHPLDQNQTERRLYARIAELERRVGALERRSQIDIIPGPPDGGVDGQLVGTFAPALWLKVDGIWRSVELS